MDNAQHSIPVRLPHSLAVEVEARRVIERAYAYRLTDPARLDAAYRVVARNTQARAALAIGAARDWTSNV